jgi:iron(III) transport system ATP-binding protein
MSFLLLDNLHKRFGDFGAVNGLSLAVEGAELVSLLGPSGCGKTTTLRLIAGLLKPDGGDIRVGGRVLSTVGSVVPPERRRMSMIFQSYAVWPHKTVFENVAYGLQFLKVGRDETRRRVAEILRVVRIEELAQRYPGELSGGQQQRVALARALVVEPQILLLDEPLSNLDANLRDEMRFEIRRLHDEFRITSVYVTHDQAEAMVTSDRIAVMNRGRIEQFGSPEEIYEHPSSAFVAGFIGQVNLLAAEALEPGLVRCGGAVLRVDGGEFKPAQGDPVMLYIRPSHIQLRPPNGEVALEQNLLRGRVVRGSYLGASRDYLVALDGREAQIRAATAPTQRFAAGDEVDVWLDPARCRLLARDER